MLFTAAEAKTQVRQSCHMLFCCSLFTEDHTECITVILTLSINIFFAQDVVISCPHFILSPKSKFDLENVLWFISTS